VWPVCGRYSGEVVRKLVDDFYKHYASKSEDKKGLQPILVSGLVLASGSVTREVELVTLRFGSLTLALRAILLVHT
jgi:hypothetical protein